MPDQKPPPIYLLDSMAFIFRAYHAMQRQRPMTTRTGDPHRRHLRLRQHDQQAAQGLRPRIPRRHLRRRRPRPPQRDGRAAEERAEVQHQNPGLRDHRVRWLQGQPRRNPTRPHPAAALHPPRARSLPHPHPLLRRHGSRRRHRHALLQALGPRPPRLRRLTRQGHDAARQRERQHPQPHQGQPRSSTPPRSKKSSASRPPASST